MSKAKDNKSKSKPKKIIKKSATKKTPAKKKAARYIPIGKEKQKRISALSKFIPSLARLKGKRRLTPQEMAALTKAGKKIRAAGGTAGLKPLTELQAKKLPKGAVIGGGIRAIRLRSTGPDAKIKQTYKDGRLKIISNGRTWIYYPIAPDATGSLLDPLLDNGRAILGEPATKSIALWVQRGRLDETFSHYPAWEEFIKSRFVNYYAQTDWTIGIAALLSEQ